LQHNEMAKLKQGADIYQALYSRFKLQSDSDEVPTIIKRSLELRKHTKNNLV